jgi:hypothetical protein
MMLLSLLVDNCLPCISDVEPCRRQGGSPIGPSVQRVAQRSDPESSRGDALIHSEPIQDHVLSADFEFTKREIKIKALREVRKIVVVFLQIYCFGLGVGSLNGQINFNAELLDYRTGLRADYVLSISEDDQGYVYFATNTGLHRYNGQHFAYIHPPKEDPSYFPSTVFENIVHVPQHRCLISASGSGFYRIDLPNYHFKNLLPINERKTLQQSFKWINMVSDSIAYGLECCAFDSTYSLFKIDITGGDFSWERIPLVAANDAVVLKGFRIYYFLPHPFETKKAIFLADNRIYDIDIESGKLELIYTIDIDKAKFDGANQIINYVQMDDGNLLLSIVNYGLCIFDVKRHDLKLYMRGFDDGETVFTLSKSNTADIYWLGSNTGNIYQLNFRDKRLDKIKLFKRDLGDEIIKKIFESKNGKLFIATGHGVYKVDLGVNFFRQFDWKSHVGQSGNFLLKSGIIHPSQPIYIFTTYQESSLWAADLVHNRLWKICPKIQSNTDIYFYGFYRDNQLLIHTGKKTYIIDEQCTTCQEFNTPWIDERLNSQTGRVEYFSTDQESTIYMAGNDWLSIKALDGEEQHFEFPPLKSVVVTVFKKDEEIYKVTKGTIYKYNPRTKLWIQIQWDLLVAEGVEIAHILFDNEIVVVVTRNHGIQRGSIKNGILETTEVCQTYFTIPGQRVRGAHIDYENKLWISTNFGVVYYDPKYNTSMWYGHNFNISQKNTFRPLICNKQNYCAFSGVLTLDWTLKKDLLPSEQLGRLDFTSILVNNQPLWGLSEMPLNHVSLHYKQNSIQIIWSHQDALHPNFYEYRYRLDKFDSGWEISDGDFNVQYQNLPPGKYTFILQVRQRNISNSVVEHSIDIQIKPPFWKTIWFRTLILGTIILIVYVLVKQKIDNIQHEAELRSAYERQLNDLRMDSLRMQMNPHFMFNSLNSIKNFILKNEKEKAAQYLSSFAFLIRSVLNFSQEKFINLHSELAVLKTYIELERLRFSHGFEYTIQVDETINQEVVLVQPLLIQPFVENAIWHGLMQKEGSRLLEISIFIDNSMLVYQIKDNGIGREKANALKSKTAGRKSMGIEITQARMSALDSQSLLQVCDLKDSDGYAEGTKVVLKLPFRTVEDY